MPGYPVPDLGFSETCYFRGHLLRNPVRSDHGFSKICFFRGYLLETRCALTTGFQMLVISGVIPFD